MALPDAVAWKERSIVMAGGKHVDHAWVRRLGLAMIGAIVTAMAAAGCSSADKATHGTKRVEGFEKTKLALVDAQRQVDTTLAALGYLRFTGSTGNTAGLNDAFKNYRTSVEQLEKEGKNAKRRSEAMREDMETQIMAWQKEMEQIKDPAIKATMQSRRDAVRSNFSLVQMYADDARKAYQPFLQSNKDIVKALSIDLSASALSGLGPAMDRTHANGEALKQRIAALQHALGNIEQGMTPIGGTAPPGQ
jgi:hypothetical protein